jgi:AMMECR1 domain-containing protein
MRARVFIAPDKIGSPRGPLRGACGVVDPARPAMTAAFRLSTRKETAMITLDDHIQELRAELRGCRFTPRERAAVAAELGKAVADQAAVVRPFDQALAALDRAAA